MSNIILIGFMASGKSKIGRMLAEKLGFLAFDLDEQLEKKHGRSAGTIFHQEGEEYFRKLEREELSELKNQGITNTVIIAGGGTPISFACAKLLQNLGTVFFLDAPNTLIEKRLLAQKHRPLARQYSVSELGELYEFRRPIYEKLGHRVDVSHEDKYKIISDIIDHINALKNVAMLKQLTLHPNRAQLYIGTDILGSLLSILKLNQLSEHKIVIVTNQTLERLQRESIQTLQKSLEKTVDIIAVPDGEQHKNLETIRLIIKKLFDFNCTRKTLILALGGGVVGDMAGFSASIFMRGVPVIHLPTTLLSMVDSSVGGKTGVDTEEGKNLIGTFYHPQAVMIDTTFLSTLPNDEHSAGMAEVIKHGIIGDKTLFLDLLAPDEINPSDLIYRAIKVKRDIVALDPTEQSIRAHLNLGHTFGHALEKVSNYEIKHGHAVAIGLVLATRYAQFDKTLEENFLPQLIAVLEKYNLPTQLPSEFSSKLVDAMLHDKKRDNQGLRLVLPRRLGDIIVKYCDEKSIRDFLIISAQS